MFSFLRLRLLMSYLGVMASILGLFSIGIYWAFSRSLSHRANQEIDSQLRTLANIVVTQLQLIDTPETSSSIQTAIAVWDRPFDSYQKPVREWENISVEWLNHQGQLITHYGKLKLAFPPQKGIWIVHHSKSGFSYQIRTLTLEIYLDRSSLEQDPLEGYLRLSQSTEDRAKQQREMEKILKKSLILGNGVVLILVGSAGLWLTQESIKPIEQSLNRLKQFTADASHELRSPLMAIKASIDVIRNHPERIHPKDVKKLAAIANATEQMTYLTRDLLFLARTDTINISPSTDTPLALKDLLEEIIELLSPLAKEKHINLTAEMESEGFLKGDAAQLRRLFANLIENAIQYTSEGGEVRIKLSIQRRQVVVTVEDTGIGIAQEDLSSIFERFWRADKARSRREGGTGLGLAIVKAIAQRHGGKITVSSVINQGSCFTVFLPFA